MAGYEYKVVPAPKKGAKAKGLRNTEAKFAHALETLMNEYGSEGWEYQRTDTLPCEERQGFRGRATTYQNVLVFRRSLAPAQEVVVAPIPELAAEPVIPAPTTPPRVEEPVFRRPQLDDAPASQADSLDDADDVDDVALEPPEDTRQSQSWTQQ